jgi:hypothetical protein
MHSSANLWGTLKKARCYDDVVAAGGLPTQQHSITTAPPQHQHHHHHKLSFWPDEAQWRVGID